jgi:acetylornithine deacetylase
MHVAEISSKLDDLRQDLTAFLQELVRIPSLPGHEQPAQLLIADKLRSLNLEIELVPSLREDLEQHPAFCDDGVPFQDRLNVVGRWAGRKYSEWKGATQGGASSRSLILNGHVDVVPPGNEALWTESPWSGSVRNGKLFGRGSCDMKAGVTAAVFALQALVELGYQPAADVLIETVIGEESGGVGTLTSLVKGFHAEGAILMEPTQLRICPVQSGALSFRLKVRGKAIHACMKPEGVSAIEKFYLIFQALEKLERKRHAAYQNPLYENPQNIAPISIGTIHAGEWLSTVPDELVAEGRLGVLPGESLDTAREALESSVREVANTDPWLHEHPPTVEWFEGQFESGQTDLHAPLVQTVADCYRELCGFDAVLQGVTYGSDLRLFTNHGRIPAVLFGPGNVAQAHTVDEYVDLDEVVQAAKLLALIVTRWCGATQSERRNEQAA